MLALIWFTGFKEENPVGFYVKTIFADGGHLGWRSGSDFEKFTTKGPYMRVCFKLIYWFQRAKCLNIFRLESYMVKVCTLMAAILDGCWDQRTQ